MRPAIKGGGGCKSTSRLYRKVASSRMFTSEGVKRYWSILCVLAYCKSATSIGRSKRAEFRVLGLTSPRPVNGFLGIDVYYAQQSGHATLPQARRCRINVNSKKKLLRTGHIRCLNLLLPRVSSLSACPKCDCSRRRRTRRETTRNDEKRTRNGTRNGARPAEGIQVQ